MRIMVLASIVLAGCRPGVGAWSKRTEAVHNDGVLFQSPCFGGSCQLWSGQMSGTLGLLPTTGPGDREGTVFAYTSTNGQGEQTTFEIWAWDDPPATGPDQLYLFGWRGDYCEAPLPSVGETYGPALRSQLQALSDAGNGTGTGRWADISFQYRSLPGQAVIDALPDQDPAAITPTIYEVLTGDDAANMQVTGAMWRGTWDDGAQVEEHWVFRDSYQVPEDGDDLFAIRLADTPSSLKAFLQDQRSESQIGWFYAGFAYAWQPFNGEPDLVAPCDN